MKLCFSILQDISANSFFNLENTLSFSKISQNKANISVTFSLQKIPLSRNFEFIPAHSVLKTHGQRADFNLLLSAIERGALHGLISSQRFGLRLRGIRVKLVELNTVDTFDLEAHLFRCSLDAIENGLYSSELIIAENRENSWVIPLNNRLQVISEQIMKRIPEDEVSDFEKWLKDGKFTKKISVFENKNPKIVDNQHWISEDNFSNFVQDEQI